MGFFSKKNWLDELVDVPIVGVSPESLARQVYIKDLALYTAIGLIADIACKCERRVYKNGHPARDDANYYCWNVSANPNQSADELLTNWIFDIYHNKDGGLVIPLNGSLYNADGFSIDERPIYGDIFKNVYVGSEQIRKSYKAGDAFYLKINDKKGRSPVGLVDGAFINYSDLLTGASDSFLKAGGEKYVLSIDQMPSGTPEENAAYMEKLKKNLSGFVKSNSAAYPLTREQNLTKLTSGSAVSGNNYAEIRKDVYNIVAEVFHLPASLLDGNMNNTGEVVNQALTFAIGPLCHKLSTEITRKTFSREEILGGSKIEMDTTQIRVRDVTDVADKLDKLISSGIMCIDEARAICSMPALNEDWSEAHFITKNYGDIEKAHKEEL